MKKLIVVALISLIGYTSSAQAKISFKNETVDYGKIVKGSDGVRVFEFTNTGDAELVVTNVKSSCGCTVPKNQKVLLLQEPLEVLKLSMTQTEWVL